ncbi:hypothetical protein HHK36_019054 [Tetracentron sinense]|uniref:Uncharacterized protein n=1 Tax=Tetracentron sinense TaxID=13715 RepID=A0A835D986_TETSI|nr:hypothetical protein HHK36_019054 [Tetracentron sinense]
MGRLNSEPFLTEKDPKAIEIAFLSIPTLEFPDGCQIPASENHELHRLDEVQDQGEEKKEEKYQVFDSSVELKMPSTLGEFKVDDDEDGFRTPTSLDHKIQVKQCPPAPRKPTSLPSTKRKASSNYLPRQIRIDLKDFASLFPPAPFKRFRGEDDTK